MVHRCSNRIGSIDIECRKLGVVSIHIPAKQHSLLIIAPVRELIDAHGPCGVATVVCVNPVKSDAEVSIPLLRRRLSRKCFQELSILIFTLWSNSVCNSHTSRGDGCGEDCSYHIERERGRSENVDG